jgi:hypothetical protein
MDSSTGNLAASLTAPGLLGAVIGLAASRSTRGAAFGAGVGLAGALVLQAFSAVLPGPSGEQQRTALSDYLIANGPGGV